MVGPDSYGISRAPHYLGVRLKRLIYFTYWAFTVFGQIFQLCSVINKLCNSLQLLQLLHNGSRNPTDTTPAGLTCHWFGLYPFRSPLLGVSLTISFPPVTEMFHFSGLPSLWTHGLLHVGFPIQTSADQRTLAPPRSFSQLATSFFGIWRQGIPRVPFVP